MFDFFTHRTPTPRQQLFTVPQADPFENPLVETEPDPLRQWATALPFANPQQLAESMITHLGRLNRFPKPVKKRTELMEIYATPALRLVHGLNQRKGQAPLAQIRRVMQEMGYGYCHVANDCLSNKANRKNLTQMSHSIYYAIKYFLFEYLLACEDFDCRCGNIYRQISRLMTFAMEQDLHLQSVDDKDQLHPERATIAHLYNRFMLMMLLDPCHLQEGEPRICFDYLDSVASEARFIHAPQDSATTGLYVVDRLGEVPPYLFHPDALETLEQARFVLYDIGPVSQMLHQQLRHLERSEQTKPESFTKLNLREINNLLARMLKSWHIRLKRDSERFNTSGEVMIWIGVPQVHAYLAGGTPQHEFEDQEITMSQPMGMNTLDPRDAAHQITARRSNQSRSGVALHLPRSASSMPLIGELILLSGHTSRQGSEWKIGVVKRASKTEDERIEIGVQFVGGKIEPITLSIAHSRQDDQVVKDHPGIFIDQDHTHRSSLIVPKHFFVIGQQYRVEEMVPSPSITPLQLLETTARFERFRIKSV
ncbi:MAG: hypothetical protein ABW101_06965 [Candidatus Thiodiazotropha sp.]